MTITMTVWVWLSVSISLWVWAWLVTITKWLWDEYHSVILIVNVKLEVIVKLTVTLSVMTTS